MPTAPRPDEKAAKIVYRILGKPANLQKVKDKKWLELQKQLQWQEASRLR